jgi:hypothetical protein
MRNKGKAKVYRIVVRSELGDRYAAAFEPVVSVSLQGCDLPNQRR